MTDPNDPIHAMPEMLFPDELKDQVLKLHSKYGGLTKREWYAGLAMQALCTANSNGTMGPRDDPYNALRATQMADALIAELSKEPTK